MAFELLEKKWGVSLLPKDEVSVSKTSISFGDDFKKPLLDNTSVEVYLDKEKLKIGFKPVNNKDTGYKIQLDNNSAKRPSVTSSKLTKLIPIGRYKAKIDENGLIVFNVSMINEVKKE